MLKEPLFYDSGGQGSGVGKSYFHASVPATGRHEVLRLKIQYVSYLPYAWIPACAGMTNLYEIINKYC